MADAMMFWVEVTCQVLAPHTGIWYLIPCPGLGPDENRHHSHSVYVNTEVQRGQEISSLSDTGWQKPNAQSLPQVAAAQRLGHANRSPLPPSFLHLCLLSDLFFMDKFLLHQIIGKAINSIYKTIGTYLYKVFLSWYQEDEEVLCVSLVTRQSKYL